MTIYIPSQRSHLCSRVRCNVYIHDLHYFPTRRSSDLPDLLPLVVRSSTLPPNIELPIFPPVARNRKMLTARKDRKSTRLNSSHQIISYAVFCLKKKTLKKYTQ